MAINHQEGLGDIDGILGLGPSQKNGQKSFLMELKKNGQIQDGIMSFSLGDLYKPDQTSYMIFGGINEDQYTGSLCELPLVTNTWWAVEMRGLYFDGKVLKYYNKFV